MNCNKTFKGSIVMIRKKTEKSNTPIIGIFTGKSAKHNLEILKTLNSLKTATSWQIAKTMSASPEMGKEALDYRARNLYSIIQRPKGRLNDLKSKGYVKKEKDLWQLTDKGSIALAIRCPELLENDIRLDFQFDVLTFLTDKIKENPGVKLEQLFGKDVEVSGILNELVSVTDQLNNVSKATEEAILEVKRLINEGIDLDRITESTLIALLMNSSRFRESLMNLLKNELKKRGESQ